MRPFLLLLALLAIAADAKSISKRAIAEFSNAGVPPSVVISDSSNEEQINSYKSMLEMLLRQLSAIEQKSASGSGLPTSAELADSYSRDYYTQAASDIVQKLIEYGALSAIVDAENAAFYDDVDSGESEPAKPEVELPMVRVGVKVDEVAPSSGDYQEEEFTDEQAHAILKMMVEELMDKFFADMKNTQVFVLGADSKQNDDEDADPTSETDPEEGDSSSSSSEEDDDYYYTDSDEDDDFVLEADDDAVIVVNKQVSTNLIRIPTATFVEALTKLLPTFKSPYPAQLQKLTPLQVEDPRVYAEHPELTGPTSGSETVHPTRVSSHSVHPIASVAPTAVAAAVESTPKSEKYHHSFDLGHILLCFAAGLLSLWAICQLYSMYRRRGQPATIAPAPAMALPPKVIPSIIPNIYATPPPVLSKPQADPEKPPVYVENPSFTKPETKPEV